MGLGVWVRVELRAYCELHGNFGSTSVDRIRMSLKGNALSIHCTCSMCMAMAINIHLTQFCLTIILWCIHACVPEKLRDDVSMI